LLGTTEAIILKGDGDDSLMKIHTMRRIGSFAGFFMFIKVFYWMRLYSYTAKYVRLIMQTIKDCLVFLGLVFVIILAFSTFYLIIDQNTAHGDFSYTPNYIEN